MAITLSGDGITSAMIAADGIDGSKIADDAVSTDHLANSINTEIAANTAKTGITSAQATAITAALPKAGGTMTGNLTLSGADIVKSGSADLTLDIGGRINLSADDSGEIRLYDGSSLYAQFKDDDDRFRIEGLIADKDIMFIVNDGGVATTALKIDAASGGDTTIYGNITAKSYDASAMGVTKWYQPSNSGNPEFYIGSSDANRLGIQTVYDSGSQNLAYTHFFTHTANNSANAGRMIFSVDDGNEKLRIDDAGVDVTGVCAATSFAGDGSALTGIDAATVSTTAPSSPAQGDMWFDSTVGVKVMKVWSGAAWNQMSNLFSATGGTITTSAGYKIHTFTSSGTFTAEADGTVDVFLVGGGGCGGVDIGGGGGAGGVITSTSRAVAAGTHSIVVGAGAPSHSGNEGGNNNYDKGTNTTAFSLTALAGGAGGQEAGVLRDGDSGGSGGGAGYPTQTGGAGTSGQGYAGGNSNNGVSGGGGGQSQAGAAGVSGGAGGGGGDGLEITWDVTNYWYAGGGGGNSYGGSVSGAGGRGGGGGAGGSTSGGTSNPGAGGIGRNAGTAGISKVGGAGGVNTGGGGGGGSEGNGGSTVTGGAGGSGIVIVRYIP